MYTAIDFKHKTHLIKAVKNGEKVTIYAPGYGKPVINGEEFVEGPHYPKAHTWYAKVIMKDGIIIKVD